MHITPVRRLLGFFRLFAWGLVVPGGLWASCVWAEEPPLLVERHTGAGLACGACHGGDSPEREPPASGCVTCHGDLAAMGERSRKASPNPHKSHKGVVECRMCHHVHRPSTDWCAQCHTFGLRVP